MKPRHFEYKGFALGDQVEDVVDNVSGILTSFSIPMFDVPMGCISATSQKKDYWIPLPRLRKVIPKRTGLVP